MANDPFLTKNSILGLADRVLLSPPPTVLNLLDRSNSDGTTKYAIDNTTLNNVSIGQTIAVKFKIDSLSYLGQICKIDTNKFFGLVSFTMASESKPNHVIVYKNNSSWKFFIMNSNL